MIREVRPSDAAALAEIYNAYILGTTVTFETEPVTPEDMLHRIESIVREYPYLVHETNGRVDGYCYVHQLGERTAYKGSVELSIYLAGESTGKGTGSRLMERMLAECRKRGYRAVVSLITAGNAPSEAISRKFGFFKAGCLKSAGLKFGKLLDLEYYELLL